MNLIPARYYLPSEVEQYTNRHWHSKSERAQARMAKTAQMGKFKRAKLDPANAKSTLEAQADRAEQEAKELNEARARSADEAGAGAGGSGSGDEAPRGAPRGAPGAPGGGGSGADFAFGDATGAASGEAAGAARPSYEELQRRLHERLAALRGARKADEGRQSAANAKQWREQVLAQRKKRKEAKKAGRASAAVGERRKKEAADGEAVPKGEAAANGGAGAPAKRSKNKFKQLQTENGAAVAAGVMGGKGRSGGSAANTAAAAAAAVLSGGKVRTNTTTAKVGEKVLKLEFSKVNVEGKGGGDPSPAKKKRRKETTQEALEKAVRLQEALQKEARNGGAAAMVEGSATRRHAWESALARAGGQKVLDNPAKLRATLKREQKSKERSRSAWAKRDEATREAQTKKQEKRRKNLQKVKDSKIAKKIDRGEKKRLKAQMRAGFEGRGGSKFIGS